MPIGCGSHDLVESGLRRPTEQLVRQGRICKGRHRVARAAVDHVIWHRTTGDVLRRSDHIEHRRARCQPFLSEVEPIPGLAMCPRCRSMSSAPVGITRIGADRPPVSATSRTTPTTARCSPVPRTATGNSLRVGVVAARGLVVTPEPRNPDRVNGPSVISHTETWAATRTP